MNRRRLSPFSTVSSGSAAAAANAVPLMAIALFVSLSSPFAEALKCVQCGRGMAEPCGQVLPEATQCEGAKDISCLTGAFINKKPPGPYVQETRQCNKGPGGATGGSGNEDGKLTGLLCATDGCNSDKSERPPPLVTQCLPSDDPEATVPGGPVLACVQCGSDSGEPCGAKLPAATPCEAKHKYCVTAVVVGKTTGEVREMRICGEDAGDYEIYGVDDVRVGLSCETAGCNFDAQRLADHKQCTEDTTEADGTVATDASDASDQAAGNSAAAAASAPTNPLVLVLLALAVTALGLVGARC